jgi:hypothetical protein
LKKLSKLFLFGFLALFLISFASAIDIQNLYPITSPFITPNPTVNISYSIHAPDGLSSTTFSWNGTNTTLYDSSLVGFWNFDNRSALGEFTNSSTGMVRDLSMYNNNGTIVGINTTTGFESLNNITWGSTFGKYGGAFNFSGNLGSITINREIITNYSQQNHTISVWIKPSYLSATPSTIISDSIDASNKAYSLDINSSHITYYLVAVSVPYVFNRQININQWTNLLFVNDISNHKFYLYRNGILLETQTIGANLETGNQRTQIGSYRGNSQYFNGSIDDVMILNRSLSQAEITQLYNSQYTKYNSTYWIINRTQNTSTYSQSYFQCATNNTNYLTCSATNTVRQVNNLKANFSNSIGNVNNYFYSVTVGSSFTNTGLVRIDDSCSVKNTLSNYVYSRNTLLNVGFDSIKKDMLLATKSSSEGTIENTSSLLELTQWAYENNKKILFIVKGVPDWLQNRTSGYCTS